MIENSNCDERRSDAAISWWDAIRRSAIVVGALLLLSTKPDPALASLAHPTVLQDAIQKASARYGVSVSTLRAIAAIESGGNARARKGSYHGVYQLSRNIFREYGGRGDIYNVHENTGVAARKLGSQQAAFFRSYGRQPTAAELYLIHQQGGGGAAMHLANPDAPAWKNLLRTKEGKSKGPGWARLAIWGNVPRDQRKMFPGGVDSVTSREFMNMWVHKMAKFGG